MNRDYTARVIADIADTSTVLPALITAIAKGNFEEAGQFLTEDVVLEIRGAVRFEGSWSGRAAVVEGMRSNFGAVRNQKPVIEGVAQSGYATAILFQEDGIYVEDDAPYCVRVAMWVIFNGPLINRIEELCVAA